MTIDEAIKKQHVVRKYTDKPVLSILAYVSA